MARLKIEYEWVVEPTDQYGDIIDPWFYESLNAALKDMPSLNEVFPDAERFNVALVRSEFAVDGNMEIREYAYLNDRLQLPEAFEDGYKVPKKYLQQVARYL